MKWQIGEAARMSGVSVRTLRYYEQIGLLRPTEKTRAGYRAYDERALSRLQEILLFREMDMPLSDIQALFRNPQYDEREALSAHRRLLVLKRERLDRLIALTDERLKGGKSMSFEAFGREEIEAHKEEVSRKWGDTRAYAQSQEKTRAYKKEDWAAINEESDRILAAFADPELQPESERGQALVEAWRGLISERFYDCTIEILKGLGTLYVQDERFRKNIDRNGPGTALKMQRAIAYYCQYREQ